MSAWKRFAPSAVLGFLTAFGLVGLADPGRAAAPPALTNAPPAFGDEALEKALARLVGYLYGDHESIEIQLRRFGFPPDQLNSADWHSYSYEEKLRHAVLMAENAEKGSGQRFLALLSADMARRFNPISEGTEPAIKDLLGLATRDPKFAQWAKSSPDLGLPPPIAFKAFDVKTPPKFPLILRSP